MTLGRCTVLFHIFFIFSIIAEEINVEVGKNASLKCHAKGKTNVWWTFNYQNLTTENNDRLAITLVQVPLMDENLYIESPEVTDFINILNIKNVQIEDEGNYSCHFDEITQSPKFYILQPTISPKIIDHSKKLLKYKIGDSITIFCTVQAYPSLNWKQKWQKNFIDMTFNKNTMITKQINKTYANFSINFQEIQKADNGTYTCDVSSIYSEEKVDITVLVLDVPQVSIEYVKAVGAHKIFMNWTVNDGNDPIQIYFVQILQEGHTTFTYYDHVIDGKNTSLVLENFQPATNYKFKLTAKNGIGDSATYSYPNWIKTLEKDPIFIPKIETTGSSASTITISWSPPPFELLEYVQNYELVVSESGKNPRVIETITYQQNSRNLPYMFDNLKTATLYFFKVRACCELCRACGPWSELINGTTMDGKASEPTSLKIECIHLNISRLNKVIVDWEPPNYPNGKIVSYNIELNGFATYRSFNQQKNATWGPKILNYDAPTQRASFENVIPNTNYTAAVFAKTRNKRSGDVAKASCQMPATTPDVIDKIIMTKIKTTNNKCVFKVFLPRISERNGNICCYRIYVVRTDGMGKDPTHPEDMPILTYNEVHELNNTKGGAYIAEMFPSSDFKSEFFLGDGKRVYSDPSSQKQGDKICLNCLKGKIIKKKMKYTFRDNNNISYLDQQLLPETTQREELTKAGNLTKDFSKILENKRRRRHPDPTMLENEQEISLLLDDSDVSALMINTNQYEVYDGELDSSSNYSGFLELIVENSGGSDGILNAFSGYFEVTTQQELGHDAGNSDDMSFIFNVVVQVLCALILLVLFLLVALCFMHRYYTKTAGQGDEIISLRDSLSRAFCGGRTSNHRHLIGTALNKPTDIGPISKNDLTLAYINRHKDTDYGFLREYEMLPNRFNDRTTKNSDLKENSHKNRYPDIKAYDQTRVKLSLINGVQGSDYINANFVIGYKERKKFICAQGPMDSTIVDFWRLIWEQHLEIIVMLTNLEEYNKSKCAKYWPEKVNDSKQYGEIHVTFASEQRFSDFLIRNLTINKKTDVEENEQRQIQQYHYLVWKDFMAPEHPYGIIKFIRQINSIYSVQRGPILVHCSAGVGRTGTMVALDSLMQQLEEEGQVSIFNTVCDLRHQRNFLVQSLKQYIFLYRTLLDISQFGNTELQAKNLCATLDSLKHKPNDSKEKCKLEFEFEKIKSIVDETNKSCAVGSGDENLSKNRSEAIIPFDRNRVILTPIPTREHSTYINASFIEGYDNSESFIITQDPLENTIGDFWRMISEQSINTLIMISEIGDSARKCPRYWADDEVQYDHILVRYVHSENCPYYTRREFDVTNCKINDTIKVTQFQYNGWPTVEGEVPEVSRGIIELVDQAQNHHNTENTFSSQSPITVHCSFGTDRSSIFVAMCILVQQLRIEKKIDVCTTARKLRSQRTMLLDTYPQYEFLHRAILNYAELHNITGDSTQEC